MGDEYNALPAAKLIWQAWEKGVSIDLIPKNIRPRTKAQGYQVQYLIAKLSQAKLLGRKIAATSLAGQNHIGVEEPLQGLLLDSFFYYEGVNIPNHGLNMRCAEPEFAFRMGKNLLEKPGKYSIDDVIESVESMFLAIEFPETRFKNYVEAGPAQLIADNGCAGYFVLGSEITNWRNIELSDVGISGFVDGQLQAKGSGREAYGNPLKALTWLVNDAAQRSMPLLEGEIITTGTCTVPLNITSGSDVYIKYDGLGEVSAKVSGG